MFMGIVCKGGCLQPDPCAVTLSDGINHARSGMGQRRGGTLRNPPQKLQAVVLKKKIVTFNVSLGFDFCISSPS